MRPLRCLPLSLLSCFLGWLVPFAGGQTVAGVDPAQISQLIEQNRRLQDQLNAQQRTIDQLQAKLDTLAQGNMQDHRDLQALRSHLDADPAPNPSAPAAGVGTIRLSGLVGAAFFSSGSDGQYPDGEFRVDEAKIFLDAVVWKDVYLYTELDLVTREATDQALHFGELYIDFENVSGHWGQDDLVNVRAGRMYIPFGEEYQVRDLMSDPLISHSASDLWGMDGGVELYGHKGPVSYAVAVQDGGLRTLNTAHSDKSVAGRIGYDPSAWLHLSVSGMRTGLLSATGDGLSALWFGNAFFRPLGTALPNTYFYANLGEVDAGTHWATGSLKAAGGLVRFNDSRPGFNDGRSLSYYYLEGVQHLADPLYAAVRLSGIEAPGGFPLEGEGNGAEYFGGNVLTTSLTRLSLGLGYQFALPVLFKVEYSPEWGHTTTGDSRDRVDLFATEVDIKF